ncbi:hypothetical protein GALMADRAFT_18605, partial [Galerina marginata CBS 339.88]
PPPPLHNTIELTHERLLAVLEKFSEMLLRPRTLRLTVHGGACMLLHPELYALSQQMPLGHGQAVPTMAAGTHLRDLPRRTATRDVDFIMRGFVADYAGLAQMDAASRLKACIRSTARLHFPGLGADWMNADPDQALPMGADPVTHATFDPLHSSAQSEENRRKFTVFRSKNRRLELVSVPPYWSVALKLVRWGKQDWGDVGVLLR